MAGPPSPGDWDDAPCGLLVTAVDGAILRANATFCRWLGYTEPDLAGVLRFSQLLPMGARVFHLTHWAPLLQMQGSVSEVQLDLLHRDGRRVPMLLNVQRKQRAGEDGSVQVDEIAAFVATDRKLYERELLQARRNAEAAAERLREAETRLRALNDALSLEHRRKDEFLATLAHELRNPLAPMASVLETLRRQDSDPAHLDWARAMLERQLRQMTHLVDDLLDNARISQGKIELRLEKVDLGALLRAAAETARPAFDSAGQTLTLDVASAAEGGVNRGIDRGTGSGTDRSIDGDTGNGIAGGRDAGGVAPCSPLLLRGDPVRLTQVVSNLLTNASKYTPAGGSAQLSLRREGQQAVITVRDDGIGIPPTQLDHIFTMFSQLTPAMERAAGGLGIGLSLTRGLVDLHGGSISAHSAGTGQGSVFTVRLPLPEEELAPQATAAPEAVGHAGGVRALIVDDNVDAADSLAMALEFVGYDTHAAYTAGSALEAIAAFQPRLALLDIGLPDFDGYELARRIRQLPGGAGILLIAATGWGQDADRQAALDAGFDLHMTKPVDFMQLHQAIAQQLA
ncbi:ATP-binding protein [Pseudoduganella sp. UC29_71]|uniref:hybrid sensor histidine kinase/response regulator n=1 Tax=Pseudoduganella sp. UC29_71 TaxID=3350174 RepID=UPI00366D5942